jgi:hypothetical protein
MVDPDSDEDIIFRLGVSSSWKIIKGYSVLKKNEFSSTFSDDFKEQTITVFVETDTYVNDPSIF